MSERATLRDVINYEPDTYLTQDDIKLIQATFRGNNELVAVLRKVLLPSVGDPNLPIEELNKDMWLVGRDYAQIPDDAIKSIVLARQDAIQFVLGGLIQLKVIANSKTEDPMETAFKRAKDSTK
jgi:hypothetical protein